MRVCSNDPTHRDLGPTRCHSCGGQVIEVLDPKPPIEWVERARKLVAESVAHALTAEAAATAASDAAKRAARAGTARAPTAGDASRPGATVQALVEEAQEAAARARRHADEARTAQEQAAAGSSSVAEAVSAVAGDAAMQIVTKAADRARHAAEQSQAARQEAVDAADAAEAALGQDQHHRAESALLVSITDHHAAANAASQTAAGLLEQVRAAAERVRAAVVRATQATSKAKAPHPRAAELENHTEAVRQAEADAATATATARQQAEAIAKAREALSSHQQRDAAALDQVHAQTGAAAKAAAEAVDVAKQASERAEAAATQAKKIADDARDRTPWRKLMAGGGVVAMMALAGGMVLLRNGHGPSDGTEQKKIEPCSDKQLSDSACRRTPEELRIDALQHLRVGQIQSAAELLQTAADRQDSKAEVLLAQIFDPTSEASYAARTSANARMSAVYYRRAQEHGEDTEQALGRVRGWLEEQAKTGDEIARSALRQLWKP